jgi:hypothetical protein
MNSIKVIHSPFVVEHSSCSTITPLKFRWTTNNAKTEVYIDGGMLGDVAVASSVEKKHRFGWVCESREIIPHVYNALLSNTENILSKFNKIFTCDSSIIKLNKNIIYCPQGSNYPWIPKEEWGVANKTRLCSMFCSNKYQTSGHVLRHKIAKLAIERGYDVVGGYNSTSIINIHNKSYMHSKTEFIKPYMFHIVVENSNYDSYWTEKITDCFATGAIPVYWGTKRITDYFNESGIIFIDANNVQDIFNTLNADLYYSKIEAVRENFNIVNKLRVSDDILYDLIDFYTNEANN